MVPEICWQRSATACTLPNLWTDGKPNKLGDVAQQAGSDMLASS